MRQHVPRQLGVEHLIIRIGPSAKLVRAGRLFPAEQVVRARPNHAVADPGKSFGDELSL
jgi:hypothetical protein